VRHQGVPHRLVHQRQVRCRHHLGDQTRCARIHLQCTSPASTSATGRFVEVAGNRLESARGGRTDARICCPGVRRGVLGAGGEVVPLLRPGSLLRYALPRVVWIGNRGTFLCCQSTSRDCNPRSPEVGARSALWCSSLPLMGTAGFIANMQVAPTRTLCVLTYMHKGLSIIHGGLVGCLAGWLIRLPGLSHLGVRHCACAPHVGLLRGQP
jgi:hypothetical protein